eukprot:CAMPEP_0179451428 /NCGR_PEP_ID=MMETSP0799-20121207/35506_1 /TAXON_ID=46947 /ORGANISM="Geminigera cryophila, Strain CCMP2564" /LENGTH=121 /DNA_ID=CAMNT_0021246725 /DNA_START=260 /DNA_END=625 /DNA_ORIENTATION=+
MGIPPPPAAPGARFGDIAPRPAVPCAPYTSLVWYTAAPLPAAPGDMPCTPRPAPPGAEGDIPLPAAVGAPLPALVGALPAPGRCTIVVDAVPRACPPRPIAGAPGRIGAVGTPGRMGTALP